MNVQSACIEMLFKSKTDVFAERIMHAKNAGYTALEFWHWSNKDLGAIKTAKDAAGMEVTGFLIEPKPKPTDVSKHAEFIDGLQKSLTVAQDLGARFLYMQGGDPTPNLSRAEQTQAIVDAMNKAADVLEGSGVTLVLEPVSDSPGGFLELAVNGFDIIERTNRPEIKLLLDLYHAAVLGEDVNSIFLGKSELIGHVHLADFPGRGPAGSGTLDLDALIKALRDDGYIGQFGYEYNEVT